MSRKPRSTRNRMTIDKELLYNDLFNYLSNYTDQKIIYINNLAKIVGVNSLTLHHNLKKEYFLKVYNMLIDINTENAKYDKSAKRFIKSDNPVFKPKESNINSNFYDQLKEYIDFKFKNNIQLKVKDIHSELGTTQTNVNKNYYSPAFKPLRELVKINNKIISDNRLVYKKFKRQTADKILKEHRFEGEGTKNYILHNGFIERYVTDYTEMIRMMRAGCKRGIMNAYEKEMCRVIFKLRKFHLYQDYIDNIIKQSREQWKYLLIE